MTIPAPPRRWLTRVALPFSIVALTLGVLAWSAWRTLVPAPTVNGTAVLVRSALPDASSASEPAHPVVQAAGWVEPAPFPMAATALIDGVVEEVLVLEGDQVKKGQPVARLVARDAEIALHKAQAELLRRSAALSAAKSGAERAHRLAETRIEITRSLAVGQAKSDAAAAAVAAFAADESEKRAQLAEAEDDLRRKQQAAPQGAVSESELVKLDLRVKALHSAVEALPARRAMLEAASAEARAELDAKRSDVGVAFDQRLAVINADAEETAAEADVAAAQAGLEEARLRRERTEITAPIDGIVLARLVAPGSPVGGMRDDSRVALFYDPKSLQVRADVANADIALVGVGERATITAEALPNRTFAGTVTRIVGQADIQKNTVQVKIALDAPPSELRPDMLCRVRIGEGGAKGGSASRQRIFAPEALIVDGMASVVGPLTEGVGVAEQRSVRVGSERIDGWVEVVEGLRPGDVLVDPRAVSNKSRVRLATSEGASHGVH